jgi:FkbM family methyltransferase
LLAVAEARRGGVYDVAGHRVRLLPGAAPPVVTARSDERAQLDALQLATFANATRAGDVVADVGAYRGTYTITAAAVAGANGRVYSFEPTPANAAIIQSNVQLNGFSERVTVEQAAVSDRSGSASFHISFDEQTSSLARHDPHSTSMQVRTIALDEYFRERTPPRVLKIDIEGAELAALRGATSILASGAFIICELHPYAWAAAGHGADDLRALLAQFNRYTADIVSGEEILEYRYGAVLLRKRA